MQPLGKFGVWTMYRTIGEENAGEAARLAERLGFGTVWLGGSPTVAQLRPLLEATEHLVVATAVTNIWQGEPEWVADEFAAINADFPQRALLGVGIGHAEVNHRAGPPLSLMSEYLDGLDRAPSPVAAEQRFLAALGPKMLALSAARTRGAHPLLVPAEHTHAARERLGPGPMLAPELACVLNTDAAAARIRARAYAASYLGLRNYASNLTRLGFDQSELDDGGSDQLIDELVPHGTADQVAAATHRHLDAGADHICLQPLTEPGIPRSEWSALSAALGIGR